GIPRLDAVRDHDRAERTRDGGDLRARREDLVGAVLVHARADLLLHPHAATATAAAEAVLAAAVHFDDGATPDGGDRSDRLARGVVLAVPTAEIAAVV